MNKTTNTEAPQFKVGAYTPAGEPAPVLVPLLGGKFIGPVARAGEESYKLLYAACNAKPEWLFQETPKTLSN